MPSFLLINPNSTKSMTEALKPLVIELGYHNTDFEFFTAPDGPASINNEDDAAESAKHCIPHLTEKVLEKHDMFLVACYSQHPLTKWLKAQPIIKDKRKAVTGIFEGSVVCSLDTIDATEKFGIVSTGKVWETLLTEAVEAMPEIGKHGRPAERFGGVETTGLNATELHDADPKLVHRKMEDATRRLVKMGSIGAVCLGCAGMAGMGEIVRTGCVKELGKEKGESVKIVDGVQAGIIVLHNEIGM